MEEMGEAGMGKGRYTLEDNCYTTGRVDRGLDQAGSNADWEDRLERHFEEESTEFRE